MIRYAVTLYHDEPEEAGADSRCVGLSLTCQEATTAARACLSDYWQTATVDAGEYDPGEAGVRPPRFTIDRDALPLRVGPDWIDR